jgi:hypothetical protein
MLLNVLTVGSMLHLINSNINKQDLLGQVSKLAEEGRAKNMYIYIW